MQTQEQTIGKARRTAGSIIGTIPGIVLIASASTKLLGIPFVVKQMGLIGFAGPKLVAIAALEITCAVLYLLPRTRSFGLLMASAYLGGAIAVHASYGEPGIQAAAILGLVWVGTWLRNPESLWSFGQRTESGTGERPALVV